MDATQDAVGSADASASAEVRVVVGGMLAVPPGAPPAFLRALANRYRVPNPLFVDAETYGRSTADLDEYLSFHAYGRDGSLRAPRGDTEQILRLAHAHGVRLTAEDETTIGEPLDMTEHVTLSQAQERAVAAAVRRRYGVIEAPAGSGKTVMGLTLVGRRRQRALWIVHTRELALQAIRSAEMVLGLTRASGAVGLVGGGESTIGTHLTVALVQTLATGIPPELLTVGHVILDEAHHAPATQTVEVLRQLPARYLLGLTATPYRRDGLDAVIGFYLGPVVATIDKADLADRLVTPRIVKRDTGLRVKGDSFTELVGQLVDDPERNILIVGDVVQAVAAGRRCLVLSDRVGHVERLTELLTTADVDAAALHGRLGKRKRGEVAQALAAGELTAVVATGSLVGEGFDCPRLDALFLATPVSYVGRVVQYIGRVSRTAPCKLDAVVTDYCDDHPMLWASYRNRKGVYVAQGCAISLSPASTTAQRRSAEAAALTGAMETKRAVAQRASGSLRERGKSSNERGAAAPSPTPLRCPVPR